MSQPRIKHTRKQSLAAHARTFNRLKRGAVPMVAIIQDKATGNILGVGTTYENAFKAARSAGGLPPDFDIADYLVVS